MDVYQRKRFDKLLELAKDPAQDCLARERVQRAFGYIDGLHEGDAISPVEYAGLFNEIQQVDALIFERTHAKLREHVVRLAS